MMKRFMISSAAGSHRVNCNVHTVWPLLFDDDAKVQRLCTFSRFLAKLTDANFRVGRK